MIAARVHKGTASLTTLATAAIVALAVAALVLLGGCNAQTTAVRETVMRYNETLADAYERPDAELMTRLTSPKEKTRITMYVLYQLKQNKLLRVTLKQLDFVSVTIDETVATARSREDWTYQHLNKDTRKALDKPAKIHYDATYKLVYAKGRWVVDSLVAKEPGSK